MFNTTPDTKDISSDNKTKEIFYNSTNILFYIFIILSLFIISPPVLEYGLDHSRWGKTQVGFLFSHQKNYITNQTKYNFITKPSNSLHHKLQTYHSNHTQILKQRIVDGRTCSWAWMTTTMGGRSSLPIPGERSNSDSSGPPSLLWSPWLELGAAIIKYQSSDSIPILNLSINSLS